MRSNGSCSLSSWSAGRCCWRFDAHPPMRPLAPERRGAAPMPGLRSSARGVCMSLILVLGPTGVHAGPSDDLAKLASDYWEGALRANPTMATSIGDRRYDDRLDDISPAGRAADRKRLEEVLARAKAIDAKALSGPDQVTLGALIEEVGGSLDRMSCGFEQWVVDPLGGPQVDFMNFADYTVIDSPADAAHYVARCRAMGKYMDDHIANLESGLAAGKTSSVDAVKKVISQLKELDAKPVEK